jgi:hypothetical protein
MIVHGVSPKVFLGSVLNPIPKNVRKNLEDSSNYRAIALMNVLMKLLDWVIIMKHSLLLQSSNMQHGFSDGTSTNTCTFMVKETINYYISSPNTVCYGAMIDASKAFDRVNYCSLFKELIKRKLPYPVLRILLDIYKNQVMGVKWNNTTSDYFSVSNGVRQGGVLSPILFCIYIDEMLEILKSKRIGCNIGNMYCGAFGYADDVILLSPNVGSLQKMIDTCCTFAKSRNILFNCDKSKLVMFSNRHITKTPKVYMSNWVQNNSEFYEKRQTLDLDPAPIYLGHLLSSNLSDSSDIICQVSKFNSKCNAVLSDFKSLNSDHRYQLLLTYCTSFYGSQLWVSPSSNQALELLYRSWRCAIRKAFSLPYRTHNCLLPHIYENISLECQLHIRQMKFVHTCINNSNTYVKNMIRFTLQSSYSYFGTHVRDISFKYNLGVFNSLCNMPKYIITSRIRHFFLNAQSVVNRSHGQIIKDLVYMIDNYQYEVFDNDQIYTLLEYICTS